MFSLLFPIPFNDYTCKVLTNFHQCDMSVRTNSRLQFIGPTFSCCYKQTLSHYDLSIHWTCVERKCTQINYKECIVYKCFLKLIHRIGNICLQIIIYITFSRWRLEKLYLDIKPSLSPHLYGCYIHVKNSYIKIKHCIYNLI